MNTRSLCLLSLTLLTATPVPALALPSGMDPDRLAQRMEKADRNHDGMITRKEFTTYRSQQFSEIDRNHDGYLSAEDVPAFARRTDRGQQFTRMIETLDGNHDGRISHSEFVNGPTPVFDQADLDRNGVIDAFEMKQFKARY